MEFFAAPMDTPGLLERLAKHAPLNPFCGPGFFKAMRRLGSDPWIAGMMEGNRLTSAAGVFLKRGRLNSTLEITSLPAAANTDEFWLGLLRFSAAQRITQIEANSYASPSMVVPVLKYETERRNRQEYVLDLPGLSLGRMSSNHRRNIRKAESTGLMIKRRVDRDACPEHVRLMDLSIDRRRRRGEEIAVGPVMDELLAFLECGCGELFQTVTATNVLSSVLVLRSPSGAYYQSAGTEPGSMASGASHFLINGIASQLREDGLTTFNLGGAPPESSLARFKSGFGATVVPLTSVSLYVGQVWRRKLTNLLRVARRDPRKLRSMLIGDLRLHKIYVGATSGGTAAFSIPSAEFRKLSEDDLHHLDVVDAGFRRRQLDRLARFGRSYAYGVIVEGKLAHRFMAASFRCCPNGIAAHFQAQTRSGRDHGLGDLARVPRKRDLRFCHPQAS